MTAQHTPGPWKFSFESVDPEWAVITTSGGSIIANVNADHRQEANAHLMAAGPDMLAALKAAWDHGDMPVHIRAQVSEAIARAEGRANG